MDLDCIDDGLLRCFFSVSVCVGCMLHVILLFYILFNTTKIQNKLTDIQANFILSLERKNYSLLLRYRIKIKGFNTYFFLMVQGVEFFFLFATVFIRKNVKPMSTASPKTKLELRLET